MTRFSVRWAVPVLAGVALLAAGCDSPPEAEKKAADAAIAAAKSAEADKYAGPAYKAVTDLQRQAETFMGEKKYKEAKAAYERTKGLADDAGKAAVTGKAAMKTEVEKGIAAAEAAWAGLEKQAQAAAKKMKPDMKKAWEEDAKAAEGRPEVGEGRRRQVAGRGQGQARHGAGLDREVVEGAHRDGDAGAQDAPGQDARSRQEAVARPLTPRLAELRTGAGRPRRLHGSARDQSTSRSTTSVTSSSIARPRLPGRTVQPGCARIARTAASTTRGTIAVLELAEPRVAVQLARRSPPRTRSGDRVSA